MEGFPQNIIAVIWDFDKTLISGYMQQAIFAHYGVDSQQFWKEVNSLQIKYAPLGCDDPSSEVMYLNHILDYVKDGRFAGLSNQKLKDLGAGLQFYPGMPDLLQHLKEILDQEKYAKHGIKLEHYVVSSGLKKLIEGSSIAEHLDGIWACEFIDGEQDEPAIGRIAYVLEDTTKTRAVFEINKGINHVEGSKKLSVNDHIPTEKRRVPIEQMLYIADGPSDVPVFSVVKGGGGKTYGVYDPNDSKSFDKVRRLDKQGRLSHYGETDYSLGRDTARWLEAEVIEMADAIRERFSMSQRNNLTLLPDTETR